ncbi:Carbamoyl-phosphate synthase large chain [Candidatus Tremblaya princeps]|uniref:Carbamoyl-phosphate synthase large chain n=1 Tax=Tremblaya princeps TaxID=189385 RepID=A0A143WNK4_TREPR|nr:Carbamoyl-phosphate synthase large chain [Candidatus Tremblaya princeps]
MPRRSDVRSVAILGAGPITIGQACEFDYSGTQACRALSEEGVRVVLINSNPATIMTDPGTASATYVEPMDARTMARILRRERPDAILATMGGQTALNCLQELGRHGVLEELDMECLGVSPASVENSEDRLRFKGIATSLGLGVASSHAVRTVEDAARAARAMARAGMAGRTMIVRPSFTLGGAGSGVAHCERELLVMCARGLAMSPIGEVLVEESLMGWKEYELEVVKDHAGNCLAVCCIENVDPMGIHTGDSVTVAPAQTLCDPEYQRMRSAAFDIVRASGFTSGCVNVQFAICPQTGRMVAVEMNPRVSRSSALASKATGYPIARVAAKLSLGYLLEELGSGMTRRRTTSTMEPAMDYVVVKMPRFSFEKFPGEEPMLSTHMQSVGEVMAIGSTFTESFMKALRCLEDTGASMAACSARERLALLISFPSPHRMACMLAALGMGMPSAALRRMTCVDLWYIARLKRIARILGALSYKGPSTMSRLEWLAAKRCGISDAALSAAWGIDEMRVAYARRSLRVSPARRRIDTCAGEHDVAASYVYSTYCGAGGGGASRGDRVVLLGSGPNRIGQGIEFDYCCVHAAATAAMEGHRTVMVNCNPETVSTDFDASHALHFEPLTMEDIEEVVLHTRPLGAVLQFGGQTPLSLAEDMASRCVRLLGTPAETIASAEDRSKFKAVLDAAGVAQPRGSIMWGPDDAATVSSSVGFPAIVRPSYVLSGRCMQVVRGAGELCAYAMHHGKRVRGAIVEQYLGGAIECDMDCVCDVDGMPACHVVEHVEPVGVHSGDSACSTPPYTLGSGVLYQMRSIAVALSRRLAVVGLMNIQFAILSPGDYGEAVYVIEVNPRASRTVPFVSKASIINLPRMATYAMLGRRCHSVRGEPTGLYSVKEAVFAFSKFPYATPSLGPEMRSTGEVMCTGRSFGEAWAKSQAAAGYDIAGASTAALSACGGSTSAMLQAARLMRQARAELYCTERTYRAAYSKGVMVHRGGASGHRLVLAPGDGRGELSMPPAHAPHVLVCSTIRGCLALTEGLAQPANMHPLRLQDLRNARIV